MAMNLDLALDLIRNDPDGAADLVSRLADQAQRDIGEVRRLVDGLRPPALDQLGLVPALRQRADEHNLAAARGRPDALTGRRPSASSTGFPPRSRWRRTGSWSRP